LAPYCIDIFPILICIDTESNPSKHKPKLHELNKYCCVKKKEDEKFVILDSNAISNPRAVMVHSQNTSLADFAMMRSWGLHCIAFLAKGNFFEFRYFSRTK
jgi:hypothetical protein